MWGKVAEGWWGGLCPTAWQIYENHAFQIFLLIGIPKTYTATGFGPRKNKTMCGVDHFLVYMQTAVKYSSLYMHHPGGAQG